MPNAQPTPRIVPRVFAEDGAGYARPAKCVLCGNSIRRTDLHWGRLPSDPGGLVRPLHTRCMQEYLTFSKALDLPFHDVTPTL